MEHRAVNDQQPSAPPAALVTVGGAFVPAHLAETVWRVMRAELQRRRDDGGRIRPDVAQLLDVLRAAAMAHLSLHGHDPRTFADLGPESQVKTRLMTTEQMAVRLHCSTRHARRLAAEHGIEPVARDTWDREDVAVLEVKKGLK